jgi:hypothetical protein
MAEKRRRRRWPIVLAIVAALLAIGLLMLRHYTRPETLTALLIENARSQLGAELGVCETGRFGFTPNLHLTLTNPSLKQTPQSLAFLSADSLDVIMPWATLWSDRYDIERIELARPVIDLDALDAWLAARPASDPVDVRFALRATDAALVSGGKVIAKDVDLDFASTGDISAWLANRPGSSARSTLLPPLAGTIDAAVVEIAGTRVEGLHIESREDEAAKPVAEKPQP